MIIYVTVAEKYILFKHILHKNMLNPKKVSTNVKKKQINNLTPAK